MQNRCIPETLDHGMLKRCSEKGEKIELRTNGMSRINSKPGDLPNNIPSDAQNIPCVDKIANMIGTTCRTTILTAGSVVRARHANGMEIATPDRKTPRYAANV